MKRIGLFGGTFNPIHLGHLRSAVEVSEAFFLDQMILVPSATPPHKRLEGAVPPRQRLEMTQLAAKDTPGLAVSDMELRRSGPSYTIDTVKNVQAKPPKPARYFLVIGADAFLEMDTWKSFRTLFESIEIIVISRPMEDSSLSPERFLTKMISADYGFSRDVSGYVHPTLKPVYFHQVTQLAISSTGIRERIRNGKSVRFLLPDPVISYIHERGLYK